MADFLATCLDFIAYAANPKTVGRWFFRLLNKCGAKGEFSDKACIVAGSIILVLLIVSLVTVFVYVLMLQENAV